MIRRLKDPLIIKPKSFDWTVKSLLKKMTSASLVDGIFVGNLKLGAVNLTIPVTALLFGFR